MAVSLVLALLTGCGGSKSVRPAYPGAPSKASVGALVLKNAVSQTGVPYKFGGKSPSGFDCSGLSWWSHDKAGVSIPRNSFKQFLSGTKIKKGNLKPGDLVFFTTYKPGPSHVGVYDGNGKFVHAPSSGKKVSKASLDNVYWKPRYIGARRYW